MLPKTLAGRSIAVLVIVHAVGIAGMLSPWAAWFRMLTPVNLLLSLCLVLINHRPWTRGQITALALAFLVGLAVEMVGVATGVIFGEYSYGRTLGFKLFEVPLVIGVNWAMLVFCTGALVARLETALLLKAALSAAVMTGLDALIEPVAIQLDFWSWAGHEIPLQNYLAWFVVAFVLLLVFHHQFNKVRNPVAVALLVIQAVFFGALNVLIA